MSLRQDYCQYVNGFVVLCSFDAIEPLVIPLHLSCVAGDDDGGYVASVSFVSDLARMM